MSRRPMLSMKGKSSRSILLAVMFSLIWGFVPGEEDNKPHLPSSPAGSPPSSGTLLEGVAESQPTDDALSQAAEHLEQANLFERGKEAYLAREYVSAASAMEGFLEQQGRSLMAPVSLAGAEERPMGPFTHFESLEPMHRPDHETRALMILANSLRLSGEADRASHILRGVEGEPSLGPVRDYVLYVKGESAFGAGDFAEARIHFQDLIENYPYSQWAPRARFRVADCLYHTAQCRNATMLYRELMNRYPEYPEGASVRLAIADCQRHSGDPKRAASKLHQLVLEEPDPEVVRKARGLLQQLSREGTTPAPLTREERLHYGRMFRQQKRWGESERLLGELAAELLQDVQGGVETGAENQEGLRRLETGPEDALRLWVDVQHQRGMNFFAWERYSQALEAFRSLEPHRNGGAPRNRNINWIARSLERLGDVDGAAVEYARFMSGHQLTARLVDINYWQGQYAQAREHLDLLFQQRRAVRRQQRYRWMDAWLHYQLGDHDVAIEGFEAFQRDFPRIISRPRYWVARAHQKAGRVEEAQGIFERLVDDNRTQPNYYSILAANRLREIEAELEVDPGGVSVDNLVAHTARGCPPGQAASGCLPPERAPLGLPTALLPFGDSHGNWCSAAGGMDCLTDGHLVSASTLPSPGGLVSPGGPGNRNLPFAHRPLRRSDGNNTPWLPVSGPTSSGPSDWWTVPAWPASGPGPQQGARIDWGIHDGQVPVGMRLADESAFEEVAQILADLADGNGHLLPRLRRAALYVDLGEPRQAREELSIVAEELRAARRGRGESRVRKIAALGGSYMDNRRQPLGIWGTPLSSAGLPEELLTVSRSHRSALRSAWPSLYKGMARSFALLGDAHYTKRYLGGDTSGILGVTEVGSGPDGGAVEVTDHPLAFEQEMRHYTDLHRVRPALMWSLMTLESAFYPQAVSRADARGLMQVIPTTGRLIARHMGASGYSEAMLLDPELSIDFGAWYMRQLLTKFRGQEILAIAGYNAGPHNVAYWLSRKGHLDADEFVEEMAFPQAQAYVRVVVAHIGSYLRTYEGREDLYFPNVIDPDYRDNINF